MKFNIRCFTTVMATSCVVMKLTAQDKVDSTTGSSVRDTDRAVRGISSLGTLERADKILGMEIKDREDHKIGKVKDMAIDLDNGRIVEVIVTTGGFLGMDSKASALPPQLFSFDASEKCVRLTMDKEQIIAVPEFEISKWAQNVEKSSVAEVYQRFDVKPYFDSDSNASKLMSPRQQDQAMSQLVHLGYVERLSKVLGMSAKNMQDEKVGKVKNVILDLPAGRLVEVVVSSGGFLGMGNELSAVPPSAFRFNAEHDTLQLDTTKEALINAPHFKSTEWPVTQPEYVVEVYRSYHVEPYFSSNNVDNAAQNRRDREGDTMTPFKQGNSNEDVETTRDIRKKIMARNDLSINAQNIKVITLDGRVTLRGVVNNEEEKRTIIDITKGVTTNPLAVDDQIEVQGTAQPTSSVK